MNKLKLKMIVIAGVTALLMVAGSAHAKSADRSLSIQSDGGRADRDSVRQAIRPGIGVLLQAGNASWFRNLRNRSRGHGHGHGRPGFFWPRPQILPQPRPLPVQPEPVTAVPEPGAALLFGAGIVLASLRRR